MLRCGLWLRRGKITDRILCSLRPGARGCDFNYRTNDEK